MRSITHALFSNPDVLVSHANGSSPNFENVIKELGGRSQASRLAYRDLWRNVRVPFLEFLPGYDDNNPTSWVSVPFDQVVPYVSLIGLPIRAGSPNGAANMTMDAQFHYQTLTCGEDFDGASWVKSGSTSLTFHKTSSEVRLEWQAYLGQTATSYPNIWLDIANTSAARQQFYNTREVQHETQSKLQLVVGGKCQEGDVPNIIRLRLCDISISYIEMGIECTRLGPDADLICQAVRIRRAPSYPKQGNRTALSSLPMARGILMDIPFTGASEHQGQRAPSSVEAYLRDPTNTLRRVTDPPDNETGYRYLQGCYSRVPTRVSESRLVMVPNTFTMASYNLTDLTSGDGNVKEDAEIPWKRGTAIWKDFSKNIYAVDMLWLSMTVLSTAALVVCAVANVIIRLRIKAPDFLTSVAGLTRDSPFVNVSNQVGSGFSGEDRLKVLGEVRVQIRDVYPDRDVGRIALTTELTHQKLKLDRDYE